MWRKRYEIFKGNAPMLSSPSTSPLAISRTNPQASIMTASTATPPIVFDGLFYLPGAHPPAIGMFEDYLAKTNQLEKTARTWRKEKEKAVHR